MKILILSLLIILTQLNVAHGKPDTLSENTKVDTSIIYTSYEVDKMPEFPGGNDSLQQFLIKNIHSFLSKFEFQGKLCFCIVIDQKGRIQSNFIPDFGGKLIEECIKVAIEKMPKWKPGSVKGTNVKTMICFPLIVIFRE